MKTFYWLLKREIWEHRSFVIVPAVIGALALLFMLIGMLQMAGHLGEAGHIGSHLSLGDVDPGKRYLATTAGIMATAVPFNAVLLILVGVFLLDALYGDRRDRSILFWKSLPVSDTSVVLSKLATATLVAPLITLVVAAVTQLAVLFLASIGFLLLGVEGWGWLWNPLGWLAGWGSLAYGYLAMGLILLPYMGWLLLASSWARRAPFLWAAVPPVALMILERWFLGSSYLARAVFGHIRELVPAAFKPMSPEGLGELASGRGDGVMLPSTAVFAEPGLWIGLAVAAAFVAGAVWLRSYRDET